MLNLFEKSFWKSEISKRIKEKKKIGRVRGMWTEIKGETLDNRLLHPEKRFKKTYEKISKNVSHNTKESLEI